MHYSVQEAADKMKISPYAIRYYENQGMLPYVKRDHNNNRILDDTDLQWIHTIICMKETGMPLNEIKHYLKLVIEGEKTVPERYQIMLKQQQRTIDEINELNHHLKTINLKVKHYADVLINKKTDSIASKLGNFKIN